MRFFTSFHYVQSDIKLGWCRHLGGLVLRRSRKTNPPKCKSIQEPDIPMRSEESHKINRTVLIGCLKNETGMKRILISILILIPVWGFAQPFPDVFAGTWCDSIHGIYEHWDKTGDQQLKGFSYEMKNGEKVISEYIEIAMHESKMTYTASVKKQNNEKPVSFVLSATDSIYTFVNPAHDFPTYIRYKVISSSYIQATVGNASRSFILNYHRID